MPINNVGSEILPAISQMGRLNYGSGDAGGLKELSYRGDLMLRKGSTSLCVTAVYEVIWRALEASGVLTKLGARTLRELKKWVWVEGEETPENPYYTGVAGGLVELGLGVWVCRSAYESPLHTHEAYGDPSDLIPGDVAQLYDYGQYGERTFGHSVVVVGHTFNNNGEPAVMTYSSDPNVNGGHGYDYWSNTHPNPAYTRKWFGARFVPIQSLSTP